MSRFVPMAGYAPRLAATLIVVSIAAGCVADGQTGSVQPQVSAEPVQLRYDCGDGDTLLIKAVNGVIELSQPGEEETVTLQASPPSQNSHFDAGGHALTRELVPDDPERQRDVRKAGLDRAVAEHLLHVEGEQEEHPEDHRPQAEADHVRGRRRPPAEEAERDERRARAVLDPEERGHQDGGTCERSDRLEGSPAVVRRLREPIDEEHEAAGDGGRAGRVEVPREAGGARLGHVPGHERQGGEPDRDVDEEDPLPADVLGQDAAEDARRQTLDVAASELEASVHDLEIVNGKVVVRGAPDKGITLASIGKKGNLYMSKVEPVLGASHPAFSQQAPASAAEIARVEVDPDTGQVTLHDFAVIQDVGKAINPLAVEGQMQGGSVQSLGIALTGDAMARPMIEARQEGHYCTSSLFALSSSAAIFSPTVKEQYLDLMPNIVLTDAVGSTETGFNGVTMVEKGISERSTGLPTVTMGPDTIVIDDEGNPIEPGSDKIGRMARSGNVPLGYYKDPEKSAETFVEVGGKRYAIPGDYARVEADGTMTLLGRGNQCINSGGEKIFPEEVEGALKSHPDVFDAIVVGVPDERWGSRVAAVVQPRAGKQPTLEQLDAHCRTHLAGYKVPRELHLIDEIKRQPSGKPNYPWATEYAMQAREQVEA